MDSGAPDASKSAVNPSPPSNGTHSDPAAAPQDAKPVDNAADKPASPVSPADSKVNPAGDLPPPAAQPESDNGSAQSEPATPTPADNAGDSASSPAPTDAPSPDTPSPDSQGIQRRSVEPTPAESTPTSTSASSPAPSTTKALNNAEYVCQFF